MNKRIEVPVWLLALSASIHALWTIGLVTVFLLTVLAPVTAIALLPTVIPATEIVLLPTPTPTPAVVPTTVAPTTVAPTYIPPKATNCAADGSGGVAGVACPLDVNGISVTVKRIERLTTYIDDQGQGWETKAKTDEFLVVHLYLPTGTVKSDLNKWFEADMGILAPIVVDENGKVYHFVLAYVEGSVTDAFAVTIVYIVARDAKELLLNFPDGNVTIDLSSMPTTVATETSPAPAAETPTPEATPLFGP
jgi:hypothetical protein